MPMSEAERESPTGELASPTGGRPVAWLAGLLLIFGLLAAWSLATPNYAAPDEPAQAFRAASLVRGQLLGVAENGPGSAWVAVKVPTTLASYDPHCFAFKSRIAASCMPPWVWHPGLSVVGTYTGRYPPLYYLFTGLPSLLTTGGSMLLWMRLGGALVNALFLTAAFMMLARRSSWAVAGGAVAVTPMVLFVGSVVNASGLEICAAIALWSALLVLVRAPDGDPNRSLVVWATASAVVLESTRALSPLFVALALAAAAAVGRQPRLRSLARQRDVRIAGVVVVAVGVVAAGWIVAAGALRLTGTPVPPGYSFWKTVSVAVEHSLELNQLVGRFGWLDTPAPSWVVQLWVGVAVLLVVCVALGRAWRELVVLALLVVACVAVPAAGDVLHAHAVGIIAQGRYILPLAVGVPLLAGVSVRRSQLPGWFAGIPAELLARAVMVATAVGQVGAFVLALQRYRTGINPPAVQLHGVWSPPLGEAVLVTVFVVAVFGQQIWFWALLRGAHGPLSSKGRHRLPPGRTSEMASP